MSDLRRRLGIANRSFRRSTGRQRFICPTYGPMAFSAVWRDDEFRNLRLAGDARRLGDLDCAKLLILLSKRVRIARTHEVLP